MANLDLIKQRLNKLQSKGSGNFEKIDFGKLFWKPRLGKSVVRILPSKFNKENPFTEVLFHEYNIFKKNVYALKNFREKDPVLELIDELYKDTSSEKEDSQALAKKLRPRLKYYAYVLVRDEEHLGVRIWEFNKSTYEKILNIMADEDFGDITDMNNGTDLTVEGYTDSMVIGKRTISYTNVNITPKRNISPISTDAKQVESLIENQKDIFTIYKKYSFDEIKDMLRKWMNPEEADIQTQDSNDSSYKDEPVVVDVKDDEVEDEPPFEPDQPKVLVSNATIIKGGSKTTLSTADKFKKMFEEED